MNKYRGIIPDDLGHRNISTNRNINMFNNPRSIDTSTIFHSEATNKEMTLPQPQLQAYIENRSIGYDFNASEQRCVPAKPRNNFDGVTRMYTNTRGVGKMRMQDIQHMCSYNI